MKIKLCRIMKVICFCLVVVLMVNTLTDLFKPKWLENRWQSAKTNNSFYELKKDSTEVVYFGASVIAAAVDPFQLYEEQGISSYNLGVMSQPMLATYFWFREALKTQKMKVAVIEIKSAARTSIKAEGKARKSYDYMKWGVEKIQYALEYKKLFGNTENSAEQVSLMEYLFPMTMYHSRWSQLAYEDYDFFLGNDNSYTRGFATLTSTFKNNSNFDQEEYEKGTYDGLELTTDEVTEPSEENSSYLYRIIKLAKEKDVKLLLVKTPDTKWSIRQHNYIQKVADENEINFLDFNMKSLREEMGFEFENDAADTIHINVKGAKKITSYLGNYLTNNYDLTDYRDTDNEIKKTYESEKILYQAAMKDVNLALIRSADDYLQAINNEDYSVIIASGSNPRSIKFTENQERLLKEFGLDWNNVKDNNYADNIICVKDGKKIAKVIDKQDDLFTITSSMNGTLQGGTDYSITASDRNCSIRLNNSDCTTVRSNCFNIIVYNKKLNEVADSVYLYSSGDSIIIGREG